MDVFDQHAQEAYQQALATKQSQITRLQKEKKELTATVKPLQTRLKKLEDKVAKLQKELDSREEAPFLEFLRTVGGLNRFTLCDDDWHEQHPHAANQLFGFATWADCKTTLAARFPQVFANGLSDLEAQRPRIHWHQKKRKLSYTDAREKSKLEQILCVRMCDRMAWSSGRAALLYDVHDRTISTWRHKWATQLGITETKAHQSLPMIGVSACKKFKQFHDTTNVVTAASTTPPPPTAPANAPPPPPAAAALPAIAVPPAMTTTNTTPAAPAIDVIAAVAAAGTATTTIANTNTTATTANLDLQQRLNDMNSRGLPGNFYMA